MAKRARGIIDSASVRPIVVSLRGQKVLSAVMVPGFSTSAGDISLPVVLEAPLAGVRDQGR